jgi:hypothetical protein
LFSPFSLRHRLAIGCQAHACSCRALGADGTMDSAVPLRVVGVFGCTGSGKSTVTQSSCALSIHAPSPIARLSAHLNQKPETRNPKPARWPGLALLFLTAIELAHKTWRDMSACNERRSAKRWLLWSGLNVQKLSKGITSSLHPIAAHRYLWCADSHLARRERCKRATLRERQCPTARKSERETDRQTDREKEWIVSSAPLRTIMSMQTLYRTILDHMLHTYYIRIQLPEDASSCTNMPMRIIYVLAIRNFLFYSISFPFLLH